MRTAKVLFKDQEAGLLTQHDDGSFTFTYNSMWLADSHKPAISVTLPKKQAEYNSNYLLPFFYNMLPEGANKQVICKKKRIDDEDQFSLLMAVAKYDTIGAVRILKQ
jgi:HipA-like protein